MYSPVMSATPTLHPTDLGEYFARRIHDLTFEMGYSDNTSRSTEESVSTAMNGTWLPIIVRVHRQFVAGHHLHHRRYETRETLCSGFVDESIRGRDWIDLRRQSWRMVREEITRMGFRHIHCYAMRQNPPAQRWIEEVCGFFPVGIMLGAVPENGQPADIVAYTQHDGDQAMCKARLSEIFPKGRWEDGTLNNEEALVQALALGPFPPIEQP